MKIQEFHTLTDFEEITIDSLHFLLNLYGWGNTFNGLDAIIKDFNNYEQFIEYKDNPSHRIESGIYKIILDGYNKPVIHFINKRNKVSYFSIILHVNLDKKPMN